MDFEQRLVDASQQHFLATKSFVALTGLLDAGQEALPKRSKSAEPVLYSALQEEHDMIDGLRTGGRSFLKERLKWYQTVPLPLAIYVVVSVSLTVAVVYYHALILGVLRTLSVWIEAQGWRGYLLCCACLFVTSFPFTLGYSLCILLVGITFGFPTGIVPAYIGSLSGALTAFLVSRRFFRESVAKHIERSTSISIAKDILLRHQLKFLFIFRMAPIPYNLINFICSGLDVTFANYAMATSVVLWKVALHVYVGSTIGSLAQESGDGHGHPSQVKIIEFAVSVAFALVFMISTTLVYFKYKKKWQAHQRLVAEGVIRYGDDILV